ncbi:MAG TPA: ABC transporter ATP-binding protein [Acidimicrobiales bacterium]|jgi:branched-chain amino acid transport system ATP-binding protein|nr:ABC transporter ATP-binding protein [Acidimicrobiales bacterium]
MLQVRGVEAGYGRVQVLRGVSLEVAEGEIVAVLGANGAGKTTTLRAISGVVPAWRGEISFLGRRLTREPPEARAALGLGHVPEGRGILASLTVEENLMLGRHLRRERRGVLERDRDRLLDLFPALRRRLGLPASSLSGGEQQMLALARALLCRPKLLMVDEMSFGLAPIVVNQLFDLVRQLREEGTTFLVVEQQAGVLAICDRTYVLSGGVTETEETLGRAVSREDLVRSYLGARA